MKKYVFVLLLFGMLVSIKGLNAQIVKVEQHEVINNTAVNSIMIDYKERKWIGTIDSVFLLRKMTDSLRTLYSTGVYSMCKNPKGKIWLGLRNNMLYDYSKKKGYPISISLSNIFNNLLIDEQYIYIGMPKGLVIIQYEKGQEGLNFVDEQILGRDTKGLYQINAMIIDSKGTIWIGAASGLYILNSRKKLKKVSDEHITAMVEGRGSLYIAGEGKIWRYHNFAKWEQLPICQEISAYRIEDMEMDRKGNLWLVGNAFAIYDNKKCHVFSEKEGFISKHGLCIEIDQYNNAWIGTEGKGLFKATFTPLETEDVEPIEADIPETEEDIALKERYEFMEGYANNHLVLLLDVSTSMSSANKLPKLKKSLKSIVHKMRPEDKISIVSFANKSSVLLYPTACTDEAIDALLDTLAIGGRSNLESGINAAYDLSLQYYLDNGNNHILIATDGMFKVDKSLMDKAKKYKDQEIRLSVLDFGGGYNEGLHKLTAKSGGNYEQVSKKSEDLFSILESQVKRRRK